MDDGFWGWLRSNAAAIQALSSAAALIVAGVLAWLTGRYVRLTRSISTSALEQVTQIKQAAVAARKQAAHALEAHSRRLRVPLAGLDPDTPKHKQLAQYSLLSDRDIVDLEALARDVSEATVKSATKAAVSLRVLRGMMDQASATNEATGWIPSESQVKNWKTAMDAGPQMMAELESACRAITAT